MQRMSADETNDNWTYMDFTRSTTSPHAAVIKRASNRAKRSSTNENKVVFLGNKKKVICFSKNFLEEEQFFFTKSSGIDGVRRNRDEGDKKPFCPSLTTPWKFPGRETRCSNNIDATTRESFEMPTTVEWSTVGRHARTMGSHVVKGATAECMTALDMPSLHSWVSEHDGVTASVPKNSWSGPLQPRKTRYDGTWKQERRPDREQTSSTASRRVGPSSIKLKSFHLPSATAVGGRPRSGATSLCMMALDVPNFQMWSKRQNSCSVMAIQGAKMRTVPSGCRWRWRQSSQKDRPPPSASGAETT